MIFQNWKYGLKNYALVCKSLIDFNKAFIPYNELQYLDWLSIVAYSPTGLLYIAYGLVILVHGNIQVSTITIGYIRFRRCLECVIMWKESWLECIIFAHERDLTERYVFFS